jgi:hypothetical protein
MYDILPEELIHTIRDRYLAGVANAEYGFGFSEEDEDSLTGALGQAISTLGRRVYQKDGRTYLWEIYYKKIRGRGPNAPEKRLGADGIFQIDVSTQKGQLLRGKGLPFQAKKSWSYSDNRLVTQSQKMIKETGSGIVVDYASSGYTGCNAQHVVQEAGGKRELRRKNLIRPLGQILGNEFLSCTIGVKGLFYDVDKGQFVSDESASDQVEHVIGTSIHEIERGG